MRKKQVKAEFVNGISKYQHSRLHKDLIKAHGNASKCETEGCSHSNPKRFEWALRKGHQYSSDPKDYIQLCVSCHRKYDFSEDIRGKLIAKKQADKNNNAKLSNEDVIEILRLMNEGVSNQGIAGSYGVHPTVISNIRTGKRWSSLTGIQFKQTGSGRRRSAPNIQSI